MVYILTLETTAWFFNLVFNIAFFPEQSYFLCIWVRCSVQSCNNGSYCKRFSQHCKVALLPEFPITLSPIEISQASVNQENCFQFECVSVGTITGVMLVLACNVYAMFLKMLYNKLCTVKVSTDKQVKCVCIYLFVAQCQRCFFIE